MTIVVAEDDPSVRDLLVYILEAEGYQVVPVAQGSHVSAVLREAPAHLLVLDLALADRHGNQVLLELQRDSATRAIPIVVVSAYVEQLVRTPQVQAVIAKPFDLGTLIEAVQQIVGSGA